MFCACESLLDQIKSSINKVFRLDIKVLETCVADSQSHQVIEQVISLDLLRLLVYATHHLCYLLHIDAFCVAYIGDRLQEVSKHRFDKLTISLLNELSKVVLNEIRVHQVLMSLDPEDAGLVLD